MYADLGIENDILKLSKEVEKELEPFFKEHEEISSYNSAKVLKAFHNNYLSSADFSEITGYGYYDSGREKLEKIYAEIFKAEDALVRPQIMSGTHALYLTLSGLLKHGDTFISITGEPYDSLKTIIGIVGNEKNSLINNGVKYEQIELLNNDFDVKQVTKRLSKNDVKLVEIQRSRGYSSRDSLTIDKIEKIINEIRKVNKTVIIMVDNCYGDFVEKREPIEVGADVIVGSLLKNLGAGQTITGGYMVGKKSVISDIADRFSAPGLGKDIGANLNQIRSYFKGLYMAPNAVCSSIKSMIFASRMLEKLGFSVSPKYNEKRTDIVQSVVLGDEEQMVKFCQSLQKGVALENYVTLLASSTPGYPHKEVMASGSFTQGSTIEFSGDGPITPPYSIYMQGGLTYEYGKLGVLIALSNYLKIK